MVNIMENINENTVLDTDTVVAETAEGQVTETPSGDFNHSFQGYLSTVESYSPESRFEYNNGRKFVRIAIVNAATGEKTAHSFVERTSGDVFKAASWAAPALHARGNIYTPDALGLEADGSVRRLPVGRKKKVVAAVEAAPVESDSESPADSETPTDSE